MYKQLIFSVATALTLLQPSFSLATSPQHGVNQTVQKEVWLGLSSGNIPSALRSQLSDVIPAGQGVMVFDVINNSPAAKAGLQKNDVILNSNQQKVFSPRQLSSLVKESKVHSKLNLRLVRRGKVINVAVILGLRDKPQFSKRPSFDSSFAQGWSNIPMPKNPVLSHNGKRQPLSSWDSFESVQVQTLADGRYQAEVKYKDPKGNQQAFKFEGKREQIIAQINKEKELPESKKQALLKALNMNSSVFFKQPFFKKGNPFDDPFFNQDSLFNDPFFQQGFPRLDTPDLQKYFNKLPKTRDSIQQKGFY